jgi:transcriptional regulator GlxA family with amidase domain
LSRAFRQHPEDEVRREEIVAAFMRFISKNPNIDELAAELRVSPRKLLSLCRSLFGDSPARLLLRFKIRRADELLRHQALRVQEVSEELGFANPYHFSNVYRRLRGRAPTHGFKGALIRGIQGDDARDQAEVDRLAPDDYPKGLRPALAIGH